MPNCINTNNDNFKDLVEKSGLKSIKLEVMMDKWMTDNNTEVWPTLEQLDIINKVVDEKLFDESTYFDFSKINMNPIFPKKHWSIGHIINTPEDANRICQITQMKVFSYLSDNFKVKDGEEVAKPIMIWAKSPLNNSQIFHWTVAVKINGKLYLYDMPQSEFIERIDDNSGIVISEYKPRLIEYTFDNFKKFYGATNRSSEINISDDDLIDEVPEFPLDKIIKNTSQQNQILISKQNVEKSEDKALKSISNTEKVEEAYSPLFTKINDDNLEEDEDSEPLMDSDTFEQERGYLSDEEKFQFETKPFANLTQTLVYQLEDINNEIAELDGRMNNYSKTEFKQLSKDKAKLLLNKSDLISKIKEAKQLNNLWQVIDFGNEAVEEVSKLMADGNLTIKGLRYAERIANFWKQAGIDEDGRFGHVLFGENGYAGVSDEIVDAKVNC